MQIEVECKKQKDDNSVSYADFSVTFVLWTWSKLSFACFMFNAVDEWFRQGWLREQGASSDACATLVEKVKVAKVDLEVVFNAAPYHASLQVWHILLALNIVQFA